MDRSLPAVAITLLATLLATCDRAPAPQVEKPLALPVPDHVVLITVDTLRADHLSSFGYPIETSPWIDSVVERGVVFRRAYSHSATTKPSHASLFTSLYPLEHGVLKNGQVLSTDFFTMAEMMRAAGYRTAGFVSTDVPLDGNVGQGFEHWDLPERTDPEAPRRLYRPAAETVDRALGWLDKEPAGARIFLWVHVYDPHNPLQPPAIHREIVAAEAEQIGREAHVQGLASSGVPAERPAAYEKILAYDAEIHYADSQLSRLERRFEKLGLAGNMLWIVTADHGQGLGAHGLFGHSVQIYNAQLHVPLVFWFSDGTVPARSVDDQVVEQVDVLPTLAELVDGDLSPQILPIRGRSLVPLLRGAESARARSRAFAQRSEYVSPSRSRQSRSNYEPGSRFALQDLDYKYLLFTAGPDELYDLTNDPHELVDLIDDPRYETTSEQFASEIRRLVESSISEREVVEVSEEDAERLRALGYVQ
jgi:arylsulfatase A-like enzyme